MTRSLKRSISPHTIEEGNVVESKRSRIFKFFSHFLPSLGTNRQEIVHPKVTQPQYEVKLLQKEPLMNNFSSEKKKRLSIQSQTRNGFTPRSSTMTNNTGIYRSYYDNLKTEREESNNDLERRVSNIYGNLTKDGIMTSYPESDLRDNSPIGDLNRDESSSPESSVEVYDDNDHFQVGVVDYPVYSDIEGNFVRPPFINLDPRERYQLLQLKKSLEVADALKKRFRFMIDPHETISEVSNSGKMDVATQNSNADSSEASLDYITLRRKLKFNQLKQSKRGKNRSGYFVGEFLYDNVESSTNKGHNKPSEKLASVSKPIIFGEAKSKDESVPIKEKEDGDSFINNFRQEPLKSTKERYGLDDSFSANKRLDINFNEKQKEKPESISHIIKLKDSVTPSNPISAQPKTGFEFSINVSDIDRVMKNRNEIKGDEKSEVGTNSEKNRCSNKSFGFAGNEVETNKNGGASFNFQRSNSNNDNQNNSKRKTAGLFENISELRDNPGPKSSGFGGNNEKPLSKSLFDKASSGSLFNSNSSLANSTKDSLIDDNIEKKFSLSNQLKDSRVDNQDDDSTGGSKFTTNQINGTTSQSSSGAASKGIFDGLASANSDSMSKPLFAFDSKTKASEDKAESQTPGANQKPAFTFNLSSKSSDTPKASDPFSGGSKFAANTTVNSNTDSKPFPPLPSKEQTSSTPETNSISNKTSFEFGLNEKTTKKRTLFDDSEGKPTFGLGQLSKESTDKKPVSDNSSEKRFNFNFSGPGTSEKQATFGTNAGKQPAFSFSNSPTLSSSATTFNFGNTSKPQFSEPGIGSQAIPNQTTVPTPSAASVIPSKPGFGFPQSTGNNNTLNGTTTFGSNNAFSKENTPHQFSFSNNTPPLQQPVQSKPSFNFTGTPSKEPTPDPAAIFGGAAQSVSNSKEGTPFNFGAPNGGMNGFNGFGGQTPGTAVFSSPFGSNQPAQTTPSQPILSNRKIAQMRQRRR